MSAAGPANYPSCTPLKSHEAHTQLNLLTKSYESRSVRLRGGCVSERCVVCVRVSGLVHKVAPMQVPLLCKTPVTPQLLPHSWMRPAQTSAAAVMG